MPILNLAKTSIYSLRSHKLRVFLTMIGIIIGISSVVTILSIGNGLKAEVNKSAEDTSANKINVYFQAENSGSDISLLGPFREDDIYSLQKINGVLKVERSSGDFGGMSISIGEAGYFGKKTMIGMSDYDKKGLNVKYGRTFRDGEDMKKLVVLSMETAKQLFDNPESSIGKGITISGYTYEVIGILEESSPFALVRGVSYISKNSHNDISAGIFINSLDIYLKPNEDKDKIFESIKRELETNHLGLSGEYKLQDPQAITKAFEKIIGGLTAFITIVTGISLFVGGIGVMNIMYVSVSERKREIGIRRAIGAKPRSILLQFLFEAILVTVTGGMIGILFGFLFGKLVDLFIPFSTVLTAGSFIGATLTSVLVGVIFGIIPAYNASRLDPIKAIYK